MLVDVYTMNYRPIQGIIDLYKNGNCCKGTLRAKFAGNKKITAFDRMHETFNLLCFECFAAGQHVDGCFLLIAL